MNGPPARLGIEAPGVRNWRKVSTRVAHDVLDGGPISVELVDTPLTNARGPSEVDGREAKLAPVAKLRHASA